MRQLRPRLLRSDRLESVSHPSLGLPPPDETAGAPAAEAIRTHRDRLAPRAFEAAVEADPTFRERYDEIGLRRLLRDTGSMIDRVALAVATNDPEFASEWANWIGPVFRRRHVPMDDLVTIAEGVRRVLVSFLPPSDVAPVHVAIDGAIKTFRNYRRLAGDARKRNRLLAFIYKGA
jgi:hypothetical protein